jgi:hypothetical protein
MRRKLLRLLPVAAMLLTASCRDKQYDLSDINTTSRFVANKLIVPLNMEPIQLDAIISIDDDSDIKKDSKGNYFFRKTSTNVFQSKDVKVEKITIAKPADISEKVTLNIALPDEVINKIEQYANDKTIAEIIGNPTLSAQVGMNENTTIFNINLNDEKSFNMNAGGIDSHITRLEKLGFEPLTLNIDVKLDGLKNLVNTVNIKNLEINLPCGMSVTDNANYNTETGKLKYDNLAVTNGQKSIQATIVGLVYDKMKEDGAHFDADKHTFVYNKQCGISGTAEVKAKDLNPNAKLTTIKDAKNANYSCNVMFNNNIVVNSFSGGIDYAIEDINIDPVNINNLPEILKESGTNIELENPQLYLNVNNPFFKNNITATAGLNITGNNLIEKKNIIFDKENNKKALSPKNSKEELFYQDADYDLEEFMDLRNLLSGDKVPEKLGIKVVNPILNADNTRDFELGVNHPGITGTWEFYTKLSLTENTKIKYTKEWDDWGSKDLDNLTIEKATVNFIVKKDVALDAESIEFELLGKNGNLKSKKISLMSDEEQLIVLELEGNPIKKIYGGKVTVNLKGKNKDLNKTQKIEISNLRVTVDGYYDKEL